MGVQAAYPRILTDEAGKELTRHGTEAFPLGFYVEDVWKFDFHCVDWHWHPEVECVYVQEGSVRVFAGSSSFLLDSGTGAFINTQVIHSFRAENSVLMPNFVFHTDLIAPLNSLIYENYLEPFLHSGIDILVFRPDTPWGREALEIVKEIVACMEREKPNELRAVWKIMSLWDVASRQIPLKSEINPEDYGNRSRDQLQLIMEYIHAHYREKITLDDLAGTAFLSKSSVINLFQRYLHTSPIHYLIDYRLKCAARLLRSTQKTINAIAEETGFDNTGYFCRKYKEVFEKTPSQYRKEASGKC